MWAIIVVLIISAVIAVLNAISKKPTPWLTYLLIALILLALGLQIYGAIKEEKEKAVNRYAGILAGDKTTLLSTSQAAYPKLKLGASETYFVWQGPEGKPIFQFFEDNELTIWIDHGQLKLSTKIRNRSGNIVAEIIGNEWRVKEGEMWERNYNKNALEVKNPEGEVILQVVVEKEYIQFAAKMYDKNGNGVAIGDSETPGLGRHGVIEITGADHPQLELRIKPIFKYPAELHLGELVQ
jgi:hypothetical protein